MQKALLILITIFAVSSARAESGWKTLSEYDWKLTYPPLLHAYPEPDYSEGTIGFHRVRYLQSTDKKIQLEVGVQRLPGKTIRELFDEDIARRTQGDAPDKINYSVVKDDWFVVSGTTLRGFEFYEKVFSRVPLGEGENYFVVFDFSYPSSERATYDPICEKLIRNFIPGK